MVMIPRKTPSKAERKVIRECLNNYLADNVEAWTLTADGDYRMPADSSKPFAAQEALLRLLAG